MKVRFVLKMLMLFLVISIMFFMSFVTTPDGITNKYLFYQIATESMDAEVDEYEIDSISVGEIIIVERNIKNDFYNQLKIGDVITFEMNSGNMIGHVITHRIVDVVYDGDEYFITTKGDNSDSLEYLVASESIIYGKVIHSSIFLGNVFNVVTSLPFIVTLIIIPSSLLMISEITKIRKMYLTRREQ
ncbi:MAG: S26 family signal peptidase [bacterium]